MEKNMKPHIVIVTAALRAIERYEREERQTVTLHPSQYADISEPSGGAPAQEVVS